MLQSALKDYRSLTVFAREEVNVAGVRFQIKSDVQDLISLQGIGLCDL